MTIDPNRLGSKIQANAQSREDKAYTRVSKVTDLFFNRVMLDPADKVAQAVEFLLGIQDGGVDKALEVLGITVDDMDNATPALPASSKPNILPLFDENDQPEGTGLTEEKALELGYVAKLDGDGNVTGYKKPKASTPATPAPPSSDDGDREVPVKDTKGRIVKQVTVKDGRNDKSLKAEIGNDGKVTGFKQLARLGRR